MTLDERALAAREKWGELLAEHADSEVNLNALWEQPEPEWLCEPLIRSQEAMSLTGPADVGKSWLVLEALVGIVTGRACLAKPETEPRRAVYLDFEPRGNAVMKVRLERMGIDHAREDWSHFQYRNGLHVPSLDTEAGGECVEAFAKSFGAELVVIDTLGTAVPEGDENNAPTWSRFSRYTVAPLITAGIAVVWLDHTGHEHPNRPRGSSMKLGIPTTGRLLTVRPGARDKNSLVLSSYKGNQDPEQGRKDFIQRVDEPVLHHEVDGVAGRTAEVVEAVRQAIERGSTRSGWHVRSIRDLTQCGQKVAQDALCYLRERGEVAAA